MAINESEELYNNTGIVVKPESMVKQVGMFVESVSRNKNKVTISGIKMLSTKEPISMNCSLRTIKYLNTKSVQGAHPFNFTQWKNFMENSDETATIKAAWPFYISLLVDAETNIGYSCTFKKLVPLTNKIFESFMNGETYDRNDKETFPFNLGSTEIKTINGNMVISFGLLNGNNGIHITNAKGIKLNVSYKHLPNSVGAMCAVLKQIASNERIQKTETVEEVKNILEGFKGTTL